MAATGIPGITTDAKGHRIIDKEYRGVRIYSRLGAIEEEQAAQRLRIAIERVDQDFLERVHRRPASRAVRPATSPAADEM